MKDNFAIFYRLRETRLQGVFMGELPDLPDKWK